MPWTAYITIATTVGGSTISVMFAAVLLGWRVRGWIAELNEKRETSHQKLRIEMHNQIAAREIRDQDRHEENLNRFTEIEVRLARMGNGSTGLAH